MLKKYPIEEFPVQGACEGSLVNVGPLRDQICNNLFLRDTHYSLPCLGRGAWDLCWGWPDTSNNPPPLTHARTPRYITTSPLTLTHVKHAFTPNPPR